MNARRVHAAEGVVFAALKTKQTAAGIAASLEAAGLLQSPESAAEVVRLRERVTELEARPAPAAVLRTVADEWSAQCPEHSEADEVWMSCPGEWVYELHLVADAFEAGVRTAPALVEDLPEVTP